MNIIFLISLIFVSGLPSLSYGYELKSELPRPPMKCDDILFGTFAAPADPSLSGPLKLAFVYCTCLKAFKEERKNASPKDKKRIDKTVEVIERFLNPILVSYSVGDFIFANTNLRDVISQAMQNANKN